MDKTGILKKYFGYDSFREGQELLIDEILAGRDVLGIMPTGAGKSICYQVPALLMSGITLVISPLISLMKDQVQALNEAGIHAAFINSSLSEGQIKKALQFAAEGRYKIIYVAPERLETYEFLAFAQSTEISMVTVDEAHCVSQWGQDFRPSYVRIAQFVKGLPKPPVVSAFTATATEVVKEDMLCILGLKNPRVLVTGFDRKNLSFSVVHTKRKNEYVQQYVEENKEESGIIYCGTRKNVEAVTALLEGNGVSAVPYHAGLGNEERKRNQDDFIYDRKKVIVATNAFGMGIDKSNVRYVLHYNMPQSLENYYQEAGRAGRDGEPAECILLYAPQDVVINRFLLESKEANQEAEDMEAIREKDQERLAAMTLYCQTRNCLRQFILRYFGEQQAKDCGNCSNCQAEYEEIDITETAKSILGCVRECRGRYGINVLIGTLRGEKKAKLLAYGVDRYESYGACRELSAAKLKQMVEHLLAEDILMLTRDKYMLVKLGKDAGMLEGDTPVFMKVLPESLETSQQPEESLRPSRQKKSDILNAKGFELFDVLRQVRSAIAKEENMPPYIIFSDKTLIDMCVELPFDKDEMLEVSGVGERKVEKYGARFLETIREFTHGVKEIYYFEPVQEEQAVFGTREKRKRKEDFFMTKELAQQIQYEPEATLSELVEQINGLRDEQVMKRLTNKAVLAWLVAEGYAENQYRNGVWVNAVTSKGTDCGIFTQTKVSAKGNEYPVLHYGEEAQRMIVEHLLWAAGQ